MKLAIHILGAEVFAVATGNDADLPEEGPQGNPDPIRIESGPTPDMLGFQAPEYEDDRRTR